MKVLFLLLCALIGGGIASGREVYVFFYRYGTFGLAMAIATPMILGYVLHLLYKKSKKDNIVSFQDLNNKLFPKTNSVIFVIYNVCLVITCATMLSGCQTIFDQLYACHLPFESITLVIICILLMHRGVEYIAKVSLPISVLMIVVLCGVGIFGTSGSQLYNFDTNHAGFMLYGGLFLASNFMLLVSLILSLDIKRSKITFVIFGVLVSAILVLIFLALSNNSVQANGEMPLLGLVNQTKFSLIYILAILFAMVTTLITSMYALTNNMSHIFGTSNRGAIFCGLIIYLFSLVSFGSLVKYGFPTMGVLGTVFFIRSLIYAIYK